MGANEKKRLPRSSREPAAFAHRQLTGRSVSILDIIGRYRLIATSAIIRLVGGNEDVTHRHLQMLYHRSLVDRVSRPGPSRNTEFAYFLESSTTAHHAMKQLLPASYEPLRHRRDGRKAAELGPGRRLFMEHELMIADFHAAIEIGARTSGERVELQEWKQGPSTWDRVAIVNSAKRVVLPHRPDAYFVLRFPTAAEGQQRSRFFYEADRGTTNTTRFKLKLQAYLSFFLSGQFTKKFEAQKIRAVLIETTTQNRMRQLVAVASELAETEPLARALFWFAASDEIQNDGGFAAVWSTVVDERLRSVLD